MSISDLRSRLQFSGPDEDAHWYPASRANVSQIGHTELVLDILQQESAGEKLASAQRFTHVPGTSMMVLYCLKHYHTLVEVMSEMMFNWRYGIAFRQ